MINSQNSKKSFASMAEESVRKAAENAGNLRRTILCEAKSGGVGFIRGQHFSLSPLSCPTAETDGLSTAGAARSSYR